MPIHPISFCIPAEIIVKKVPTKDKLVAGIQYNSRAFNTEEEYYREYQRSVYGHTKKKAGWDCLRHYEILANGCIPYFENIDNLPPNTMVDFPKALVKRGMKLSSYNREDYEAIIEELLEHTRKNLTTEARAKYIIEKMGKRVEDIKSVLYISDSVYGDYLRCTVLHGFKMLFKEKCVDMIRVPHIYDNYPPEIRHQIWPSSFTYAFRVPAEYDIKCDRMHIAERIMRHEYDLIVFGSVHRGLTFLQLVLDHYKEGEVAFLCGEDVHDCDFMKNELSKKHHIFIREL